MGNLHYTYYGALDCKRTIMRRTTDPLTIIRRSSGSNPHREF
uniref:Uncharacterized protein n=1 Tax=Solanum lycopersicum TaxID=4081 RepID=A0A3Q7IV53_SOLLC